MFIINLNKKILHNFIGDTIVEVLIVLAILGGGLILSYSIATRAYLIGQDAQDRNTANGILKSQIEELRASVLSLNSSNGVGSQIVDLSTSPATNFCLVLNNGVVSLQSISVALPSSVDFSLSDYDNYNSSTSFTQCKQGIFLYYITKSQATNTSAVNYVAHIYWPNVFAQNVLDQSVLAYRVYPQENPDLTTSQ